MTDHLTAHDLVPAAIADWWQDSIPVHSLVLIDAIRPDGAHGLHAVHDTDAPVWVLIGMLRAVLVDLEHRWADADWIEHEETEDD